MMQRLNKAVVLRLRNWLGIEQDRKLVLNTIATAVSTINTCLELMNSSVDRQTGALREELERTKSNLEAVRKRLVYYGEHNDSLKFTKRRYDELSLRAEVSNG